MLRFLSRYLPRHTLNELYKLYVRPHLDYGDVIYHNPPKVCDFTGSTTLSSLMEKLESVQYSAALAITGAWRGTSREKLYLDLGWEFLSLRRWSRRFTLFYKVINNVTPDYTRSHHFTRSNIHFVNVTRSGKYEQGQKNINLVFILTVCPSGINLILKLDCHLVLLFSRQRYHLKSATPPPLQNLCLGFMTQRACLILLNSGLVSAS